MMTPARDSLRRRSIQQNQNNVTINDDEEERRQARRRTLKQSTAANETSTFEDNETLKKCLEIYNGNKLSRENAWSLSLIDTLSALLDRHHKSLNNFKVAGSSLEASSKVYGLRVDSIHMDVLRMSAGLNAQKFSERDLADDDDDGVATGGDGAADPGSPAAGAEKTPAPKAKPKRTRRLVSTITKNKETLNGRLDTVPLQDPVFGKLNSIVGSINASNRLMINILLTADSELKLRTNFRFFDVTELPDCDYTELPSSESPVDEVEEETVPCDRLFKVQRFEDLELRPLHGGYVISDTPEAIADDREENSRRCSLTDDHFDAAEPIVDDVVPAFHNSKEMSMAFDINAECEPLPPLNEQAPMLEVDYGDYDDLTREERTAINNCRGLRKAAVLIEDLRPVDASSKLEYSYRPIDKISQFWAGPSHWKFKRTKSRASTLSQGGENTGSRSTTVRGRRAANQLAKRQSKQLNFNEFHDELFIKLDNKYKARKVNMHKKWDQRKLKLPTDLQLDPHIFYKFQLAPGLTVKADNDVQNTLRHDDDDCMGLIGDDLALNAASSDTFENTGAGAGLNLMSISSTNLAATETNANELGDDDHFADADCGLGDCDGDGENVPNNTVLEIATEFEGAPRQVTKIIVPFAKRAKVIDMKNLKRCCAQLLHKQMRQQVRQANLAVPQIPKEEQYAAGMASFKEIYDHLPELLNPSMVDAVTPSIAFYSVLHLANDFGLRLIQQDDLNDFKIRQLLDEANANANTTTTQSPPTKSMPT